MSTPYAEHESTLIHPHCHLVMHGAQSSLSRDASGLVGQAERQKGVRQPLRLQTWDGLGVMGKRRSQGPYSVCRYCQAAR